MSKKPKKANGFVKYNTYLFTDKDPIIDVLRTVQQTQRLKTATIVNKSNVAASTIQNWFGGKTKRPQFATVAAVGKAMGLTDLPIDSAGRQRIKNGDF